MPTCRVVSCDNTLRKLDHFYCAAHWAVIDAHLTTTASILLKSARHFYIGRSNYPERRLLEHWCGWGSPKGMGVGGKRDHLAVLHWSGDRREIDHLERQLIATFDRFERNENQSHDSDGTWAGAWHCLYVSWAWKRGHARPGLVAFEDVRSLQPDTRLWPRQGRPAIRPTFLFTSLSQAEAREVVRDYYARDPLAAPSADAERFAGTALGDAHPSQ